MKKIVWTFGLISGVLLAGMLFATMPFQEAIGDLGMVVGYTTMVLSSLFVFFGVRSYRDNVAGGTIKFGRAFGVGMLIVLISTTCYVVAWEVIYFKITPEFGATLQARALEKARADGATEAEMQAQTAKMEKWMQMYNNPLINAAITFLEPLPVGLLFALASAGILSRRKRQTGMSGSGAVPA